MWDHTALDQWLHALVSASPGVALTLGVVLTVIGSCFMAVGSVVMKTGIHQESERLQEDVSMPLSSRVWWLGLLNYSFGAFLHIVGLAFAPASVLAPLNSLGLVANAVAAVIFLDEVLSWVEVLCTVGTVLGVTLCAMSSFLPHDESFLVNGVDSWTDPPYLVYIAICGVGLLAVLILVNRAEAKVAEDQWEASFRRHIETGHIELTELAAVTGGNDDVHAGLLKGLYPTPTARVYSLYPSYIGILYGVVAGIVGAQCVLQLKEFSAFLKVSVDDQAVWWTVQPYLVAAFGAVSIVLQMHFLNLGLARGDATLVIPTYYVFWTILGTVGGRTVLGGFTTLQIVLFLAGLILTLICVALMASGEVERVQIDVEKTAPTRPGFPEEVVEAPLAMGVPLALGIGVIPVGRLAGRFRSIPLTAGTRSGLRRTRSLSNLGDIPTRHRPTSTPTMEPTGPTAAPYTWTITEGFRLPGVGQDPKESPSHPSFPRMSERPLASHQKRKYRGVKDIVFEEAGEHGVGLPSDHVLLSCHASSVSFLRDTSRCQKDKDLPPV